MRNRYINGQAMKSPARLGDSAPRTSTPSTGVETRSAGESAAGIVMARLTLGEAYDTAPGARAAVGGVG